MHKHLHKMYQVKYWGYKYPTCGHFRREDHRMMQKHIVIHRLSDSYHHEMAGYQMAQRCSVSGCHFKYPSQYELRVHAAGVHYHQNPTLRHTEAPRAGGLLAESTYYLAGESCCAPQISRYYGIHNPCSLGHPTFITNSPRQTFLLMPPPPPLQRQALTRYCNLSLWMYPPMIHQW